MNLDKNFKRWCSTLKLKPHHSSMRHNTETYYFKGRGFVWRVNCLGMFERGDRLKDFNRWALCNREEIEVPTTFSDLKAFVEEVTK